jgi:hypothetical protein
VDAWLREAVDALARESGVPPERLELDEGAVRTLLEVARVAAHESGERTNAPLLCYLLGLSAAGGRSLDELADAVTRSSS